MPTELEKPKGAEGQEGSTEKKATHQLLSGLKWQLKMRKTLLAQKKKILIVVPSKRVQVQRKETLATGKLRL